MNDSSNRSLRRFLLSRSGLVLGGFLLLGGYLLWAEHQAHIIAYLPLILVLGACVTMHLFMHGGHGGGHGSNGDGLGGGGR